MDFQQKINLNIDKKIGVMENITLEGKIESLENKIGTLESKIEEIL